MRLQIGLNSTVLSFVLGAGVLCGLVGGLMAGQFFTMRTMQVAQAASQERQLAAIQSARGAMNLIKYDMERAGYVETSPMSRVSFQVHSSGPNEALQLKATPQSLVFQSPDSRDTVEYRCEGRRLSRIATGHDSEHVRLLENALNFQIRQSSDGSTVNVAFAIPAGGDGAPASQSAVLAHFVRSTE